MKQYIRPDLRSVKPYSSARDEFSGKADVWLDANENSLATEWNRYPDPLQIQLKQRLAVRKNCTVDQLFIGNGSDEVLDLILRLTCTPFQDTIALFDPSYGMYEVLARTNGLKIKRIALSTDFTVDWKAVAQELTETKVFFVCNPNNPTGNSFDTNDLKTILTSYEGVMVVDEAYIDFSTTTSMSAFIHQFPNLIVVQTLSKAYGMAGLRIGMALANADWIHALNSIKPPYNVSSLVQETAIDLLQKQNWNTLIPFIISERERVAHALLEMSFVSTVFPSQANFILFRIADADQVYAYLAASGVVVRNRSNQFNCQNTLRVTIGTPEENNLFLTLLNSFYHD